MRIAATLVQAAAQAGHVGFAQGIVDWLVDGSLGSEDERRLLSAIVGSSGVPPALRTRVRLEEPTGDSPWRAEFDVALAHARGWRLSKALTAFRSLKGVAGESRQLFTNIAVLCEMMARPVEASEAWLAVSRLRDVPRDDAVEAVGRALALETEADPDRSPVVRFVSRGATLSVPAGEEGTTAIELLEDKIRHDPNFDQAVFDRSTWVSRGAVPPRSAWRVYGAAAAGDPGRLLATLLVFGRQTDREPEAVLQGFEPDVGAARPAVEALGGGQLHRRPRRSGPARDHAHQLAARQPVPHAAAGSAAGNAGRRRPVGLRRDPRRAALRPVDPLPRGLARHAPAGTAREDAPRGALRPAGRHAGRGARHRRRGHVAPPRRLRRLDGRAGQARHARGRRPSNRCVRSKTASRRCAGIGSPMQRLGLDELRGVFVTALDAGFERAAELAAEALVARSDASPEDRWEAFGVLEDRATSSVRKLEILGELRDLAVKLRANDGMLDVAELRVRMQRGDEADSMRLFEHLRRDHSRDQQVLQALAEVLMEAGVDLRRSPDGPGPAGPPRRRGPAVCRRRPLLKRESSGRRGATPPGPTGEKKVIWTPT